MTRILFLALILSIRLQGQSLLVKKWDQSLEPYVKSNNFMGTVLVSKEGKILYEKSFGKSSLETNSPNTNASVYHLASLSKPFTAAAILILEQQGKLKTDDLLVTYLPDFTEADKITLHHLLTHSSGILNINNLPVYNTLSLSPQPLDSLINVLKRRPLDFAPGTRFAYSNSNYNVLAYIIEKVSGMRYGEFLKRYIFEPAGMKSTFHHGDALAVIPNLATGYADIGRTEVQRAPYLDWTVKTGNGSLCSTAEDLMKFDQAISAGKILNATSLAKMYNTYMGDVGYGLFARPDGKRERYYMSGRSPGFTTYMARYPKEKVFVAVLGNQYTPAAREIGSNLTAILFGEPKPVRHLADEALSPTAVADFEGQYAMDSTFFRPGYKLSITAGNGRLRCDFGELLYDYGDEFILRGFWSVLRFERDSKGKVVNLSFDTSQGKKLEK